MQALAACGQVTRTTAMEGQPAPAQNHLLHSTRVRSVTRHEAFPSVTNRTKHVQIHHRRCLSLAHSLKYQPFASTRASHLRFISWTALWMQSRGMDVPVRFKRASCSSRGSLSDVGHARSVTLMRRRLEGVRPKRSRSTTFPRKSARSWPQRGVARQTRRRRTARQLQLDRKYFMPPSLGF